MKSQDRIFWAIMAVAFLAAILIDTHPSHAQDSLNDVMALQTCITNVRHVYAQWDYQTKPYLKGAMQAALETCPT